MLISLGKKREKEKKNYNINSSTASLSLALALSLYNCFAPHERTTLVALLSGGERVRHFVVSSENVVLPDLVDSHL